MNDTEKIEQQTEAELKYALYKNSMVHISEVISGLNSGEYLCPKCHSYLIAKKGDVRVHHFAHYNYEQCHGAQETALHRLAKEILLQEKMLAIPNASEQLVFVEFDEITVETRLLSMIVDVLAIYSANTLAIEIKVCHEVDARKAAIVKENAIDMIEIDLSDYIHTNLSREELTNVVLKTAPRHWINSKPNLEVNNMLNKFKTMGFVSSYGYSRKHNCNFEKRKLYAMQPIEKKNTQNYTVTACAGYELIEFDIDDNQELYRKLECLSFPCDLSLTMSMAFKGNKQAFIVTDVNPI